MRSAWLATILLAFSVLSSSAQDSPPLDMGWQPAIETPRAIDDPRCGIVDQVAACTFPAPIYAHNLMLAKKGNVEAAYQVGLAYLQGWGVAQNVVRAEYWFLIGAQTNYEKRWVGERYRDARYVAPNLERFDFWLRRAGDRDSLLQLAKVYRAGTFGISNPAAAADLCLALLSGNDGYVRLAEFELGNMVLDRQYTSGDPRKDLRWAREIAQELIGGEELRLAWANGSAMDLPGTPGVERAVLRSAAAFDADLGQMALAKAYPGIGPAERYAWEYLAGRHQADAATTANLWLAKMSVAERKEAQGALVRLEHTRGLAGAYYRDDDPLLAPDFSFLERHAMEFGDPEEQLRLAYHYEQDLATPEANGRALDFYKKVRDERVASVRLRIANEYAAGLNGFPQNAEIARKWYGFAAKAGSEVACKRLALIPAGDADGATSGASGSPCTRSPRQ